MTRTLYHVTHRSNLAAILRQGLQPGRAKTAWRTVWLCNEEAIEDIIVHMSQRHGVSRRGLIVIRVEVDTAYLKRNRAIGIYHYPREIVVDRADTFIWERGGLVSLNE